MTYQKEFTTVYTINGREYKVTAPALFDSVTNELIPDKRLDDQAAEKARQQYRKDMGLITPQELKQYRAKVGLSQRNLAELTGLSPNTIALYEAGAFPTTANNKLLRSLINNDQVLQQYLVNDSDKYSSELIRKVNAYLSNNEDSVVGLQNKKPKFTAVQLANWFRVENYFEREVDLNVDPITQMKVIKLLYIAFGRYLATTSNRLFSSPIIHLQYGPVVVEAHERFNGLTALDQDPNEEAISYFINYNASRLSKLTHQPGSPWSLTPDRMIIKDQLIFNSFK
ncbi:type II toxin-antitoxin system antitoxin SocA domain-containing protein [Lactobacillus sp. PSON]|uniref:type II toxin-antitoxin system antitoxin SocA domain-containing protein n=1 Tax=Lactobacillus sp. PSON TaxID=3455454 RepID=UPI0040427F23